MSDTRASSLKMGKTRSSRTSSGTASANASALTTASIQELKASIDELKVLISNINAQT